jgi:hypothetical protein
MLVPDDDPRCEAAVVVLQPTTPASIIVTVTSSMALRKTMTLGTAQGLRSPPLNDTAATDSVVADESLIHTCSKSQASALPHRKSITAGVAC